MPTLYQQRITLTVYRTSYKKLTEDRPCVKGKVHMPSKFTLTYPIYCPVAIL